MIFVNFLHQKSADNWFLIKEPLMSDNVMKMSLILIMITYIIFFGIIIFFFPQVIILALAAYCWEKFKNKKPNLRPEKYLTSCGVLFFIKITINRVKPERIFKNFFFQNFYIFIAKFSNFFQNKSSI